MCRGQHRFSNEFSGNGAGEPHFFTFLRPTSLKLRVKLLREVLACERAPSARSQSVQAGGGGTPLLFTPRAGRALQLRFRLWLHLIQSGPGEWVAARSSGDFLIRRVDI